MNYMSREIRTQSKMLRTELRFDETGLLFLESADPCMLLTLKVDSETLVDDIFEAIKGYFMATERVSVDLELLSQEGNTYTWFIKAPAFERVLQVA